MTWVKICGITNLEDALVAVDAGADAVGFVFYEKSPRCVSVETAKEIIAKLPDSVEKVGVFVRKSAAAISETIRYAGLTVAQVYFDLDIATLSDEFLANVPSHTIAAVQASHFLDGNADHPDAIAGFHISQMFRDRVMALMLDAGKADYPGGSGERFDWDAVAMSRQPLDRAGLKLVVAGGLTSENVCSGIHTLRPWGVDVASGVEARPGKKDPEKVQAFVRAVREYDARVS